MRTISTTAARDRIQAPPASGGRLILVTSADMAHLALVLGPAIRRLARAAGVVLAEPTLTRRMPAGSGTLVSPSQFGAADCRGDIVLAWAEGTRSFGYPASIIDLLEAGRAVVAGVPAGSGAEHDAFALWPSVAVIHLETGTERLRRGIARSPASARSPLTFAGCAVGSGARVVDLSKTEGLAAAVVAVGAAIDQAVPKRPSRAARERRAAMPGATAALREARARLGAAARHTSIERPVGAKRRVATPLLRSTSST